MLDRDDCRGAQLCRAVSRKLHRVQHDRYAGRCVGHRAYEHHMVSHLLQFYYFIIFHKVIIFLLVPEASEASEGDFVFLCEV